MDILGIGTDIVECLASAEARTARKQFLTRVFTERELR